VHVAVLVRSDKEKSFRAGQAVIGESEAEEGLVAASVVNPETHFLPEYSLYLVSISQGTECGV